MSDLSFVLRLDRAGSGFAMDGALPLDGVTAIVGPSGSGKTTLLMMLAGLEPDAKGEILFGDEVWLRGRRSVPPQDRRVGLVFQDGRLFDHLSVADNLAFGAQRRGLGRASLEGIVQGMGLGDLLHRTPPTLSGGEARRVAVARALASGPRILFMDEPLAGLDDGAKARILPYIARAVTGYGLPVVYVTHSRNEVGQFADRILRIEAGRVAGWDPVPPVLSVTVVATYPGAVAVALGQSRFTVAGQGQPGDAREIVILPGATLLSRSPPGDSDALIVLPATAHGLRSGSSGHSLTLRVEGQSLDWTLPAGAPLADRPPSEGERVWLSILETHLR